MITAHMDTMSAVALSTDSVTTTLIITVIVLCLLLLAQGAVPLGGVLRHQTHILTLEFETPLLLLMLHDVTSTEMTEDDVLIELTITVEADHLIPPSQDTLPHNGPQDRPPKLLTPLKELLCPLAEAHDLSPAADLQALILSAAPAVRAVAAIQTAAQVMDHGHVLFSRRLHTHHLSLLWFLIQMSHVEALESKCKTYQCAPQTQV